MPRRTSVSTRRRVIGARTVGHRARRAGISRPCAMLSSTWRCSASRRSVRACGPISVVSSSGSPIFAAAIRLHERCFEASHARSSTTMKRLAAMQLCPELTRRAFVQTSAASSRSASSSTRYGSLPPSSSTVFFSSAPAFAATARPAGPLPVSVTARTSGCSITRVHLLAADHQRAEQVLRKSRAPEHVLDRERAAGHVRRVLQHGRVARHQARRREAEHLPERKVPRHHREHDAERIERDVSSIAPRYRTRSAREESRRVVREIVAGGRAFLHLARRRRAPACPFRAPSDARSRARSCAGLRPPCASAPRGRR